MKKILATLLALVMLLGAISAVALAEEDKGITGTYYIAPKNMGGNYWGEVQKGVEDAAADYGLDVIMNGPSTASSVEQISMMEDMIAEGVVGIAIAPNDAEAAVSVISEAQDEGIAVITLDSDSPNSTRSWYVGPDSDANYGIALAKEIGEKVGSGEIAFMCAGLGAQNQIDKMDACRAYLEENYPDITIVTTLASNDDATVAYANAQNLLQTYPDLKGIVGFAGGEPTNAARALREAVANGEREQGEVAIVGVTFPNQAQEYFEDGSLESAIGWSTYAMGYVSVVTLYYETNGWPIDDTFEIEGFDITVDEENQTVFFGMTIYTPENYQDYL